MSKILDTITNAITSTPEAVKPAKVKKVKAVTSEAVKQHVLSESLELLVQNDYKASKLVVKSEGAEYATFKALVLECEKAGVFADPKLLRLVQTRIAVVFNSDTIVSIRNTMLTNTGKVAYGGTVGRESDGSKRTVSGKGWGAVLEVLTKATSIRTYRPMIAAAKPEGLKAKPKSPEEVAAVALIKKQAEEQKAKKEAAKKTKTISHDEAYTLAIETLKMLEKFMLPGSNAAALDHIHKLERILIADLAKGEKEAAKDLKAA